MNIIIDFRTHYTLKDIIDSLCSSPKDDENKAEERQDVNAPASKFQKSYILKFVVKSMFLKNSIPIQ